MRPFNKAGDLVDQPFIYPQFCALPVHQRACAIDNCGAAFCTINHHITIAQPANIVISAGNTGQRNIITMFEIMPAAGRRERQRSATHIQLTRQCSPVKQDIDPVQRTHPPEPRCPPALAFWPGEIGQNSGDHVRQERSGSAAFAFNAGEQKSALRRILFQQSIARQAS